MEKHKCSYKLPSVSNLLSCMFRFILHQEVGLFFNLIQTDIQCTTWRTCSVATRTYFCSAAILKLSSKLRYHGRWIDSVLESSSYAVALKENPINLYIF